MLRPFFLFLFLYMFLPLFSEDLYAAGTPHFSELTTVLSKDELLLFASLKNSVNQEMEEALQSGIPLKFSFTLQLLRPAAGRANELLFSKKFTHTISYDTLTDEYSIDYTNYNEKNSFNIVKRSYKKFHSALNAVNTVNAMPVVPTGQLLPDNSYRLRLKADLFHKKLPQGLDKLLPFLRWEDRQTGWQEVNFRY